MYFEINIADAAGSLLANCPVAKNVFKLKYEERQREIQGERYRERGRDRHGETDRHLDTHRENPKQNEPQSACVAEQHTRELISARKTSHKHNNKDLSRLR